MSELLKFEYYRILKSKIIWVMEIAAAVIPLLVVLGITGIIGEMVNGEIEFDDLGLKARNIKYICWYAIGLFYDRVPLIMALFTCLFVGRDYRDGFIRNKITAGHSRFEVFFSTQITQASVTVALCVTYILFTIIALALTPVGVNLNRGEMLVRALVLILSLVATTTLFTTLSLLTRNRAAVTVLCVVFVMFFGVFGSLANQYSYSASAVKEYVELYEDELEKYDLSDIDEEDIPETRDYLNGAWYTFHPLFLLTNAAEGDELCVSFSGMIMYSDFGNDFEYPKTVIRAGFVDSFLNNIFVVRMNHNIVDTKDILDIKGVEVPVGQVELEYTVKSLIWTAIYTGCGYALFKKKNLF